MMGVLRVILWVLAGILGTVLAVLLLVLLSPVRVRVALKEETLFLWAGLGPVKLRILPPKSKKPKKPKKKRQASAQPEVSADLLETVGNGPSVSIEQQPEPPKEKSKKKKGKEPGEKKKLSFQKIKLTIQQLTEYLRLAVESMGKLSRLLVVRRMEIHGVVATGDAASTALAFGSAAAALNLLLPWLEQRLHIKKQDISVDCAFDQQQSTAEFDIEISALVLLLVIVSVRAGLRFWRLYKENQKKAVSL